MNIAKTGELCDAGAGEPRQRPGTLPDVPGRPCPSVINIVRSERAEHAEVCDVAGHRMSDRQISDDIEILARMAARLAGRDPDDRTTVKLGDITAFDDLAWRYPDFLARANAAYDLLKNATLTCRSRVAGP